MSIVGFITAALIMWLSIGFLLGSITECDFKKGFKFMLSGASMMITLLFIAAIPCLLAYLIFLAANHLGLP